jgi:signal transduction histidine kinase
MAKQYLVTSIEFYDPSGRRIKGWPTPSPSPHPNPFLHELIEKKRSVYVDLFGKPLAGEGQWFSAAIWRKTSPGIVSLQLDNEQMRRLFRQFAFQKAISDLGFREGVLYVSVQDVRFAVVAHTDPGLPGRTAEDPFLRSVLQGSRPLSRLLRPSRDEEAFEVAKSFSFRGAPMGLIRVGYSAGEIRSILRQTRKTVALSIFFFLLLGVSAIALIWTNQNRHLQKMKEMGDRIQLAERLSSLGHLAAGVAHEIRNPLNAMGMGIQRLKREFPPTEESKRNEFLSFTEIILKEIRRINQIIEQFLSLSRPFQLSLKNSSPKDLLSNLVILLREEASSQGIRLDEDIGLDLPLVQMDEEKLTQALINIMKNGIQAMDQGGVLRIKARASRDSLEIKISDSGAGIAPDQMEKIFNYYYTTKEKGVGLGLPIAHRIIEAHQGQLKVESQLGAGTEVTVVLPVRRQ